MTGARDTQSAAEERDSLLFFLARVRDAVVRASDGLSDDDLRAPGVPSGTNLLGLVQHLPAMEMHWFQTIYLGDPDVVADESMHVAPGSSRAEIIAAYREACARSDAIVRHATDLSTPARTTNPGEHRPVSLRRILAHMLEETARHAGHADILREQIDGSTDS